MKLICSALILSVIFSSPAAIHEALAAAQPPEHALTAAHPGGVDRLCAAVEAVYHGARDFSARFQQTLIKPGQILGKPRVESGAIYLKNPDLMRWDYERPEPKHFIFDGRQLWFYKPDEAQVMLYEQFQTSEVSAGLMFLLGKKKIKDHFRAVQDQDAQAAGEPGPQNVLRLTPKNHDPQVQSIVFHVDGRHLITQVELINHLGQINRFEFKEIKLNQGLKKEAFLFAPPNGVKVFRVN